MSRIRIAAGLLTVAGFFAWVVPSQAYRMMYPPYSGRTFSYYARSCDDTTGFAYWTYPNVSWIHSTEGTGAGKEAALQSAMNAWTNVANAGHVLTYAGTTPTSPGFQASDGVNTLSWGIDNVNCPSGSCLAVTALSVQATPYGYNILESDILFSDYYPWNTNGSAYDVQAVATHELGHSLGIGHTDVVSSPLPTMYAAYNGTDGRTLEADDRQALECSDARYLNPVFYGSHTVTNCRKISGTAGNSRRPNLVTRVEIRDGGTLLANLPADGAGHTFTYTPTTARDGRYHTINVNHAWNGVLLSGTSQSLICQVSIFRNQMPSEFNDTQGTSWSVGNDFTSSISGYVTRLRYYRAAEETGVHTLQLWTLGGTLLGSATVDFGSSPTPGWVMSPTLPGGGIAIQAGVGYTVTVTTYTKQSKTPCGFGSGPITNGPLSGTGGRWVQGDGIFPTNGSCSNFWTDVVFDQ